MIKELDIIGSIIESLKRGDLTQEKLLLYFQNNSALLRNNIESAYVRYGKENLHELVKDNFARYFEHEELVLSNRKEFSVVKDQVIDKVKRAFDNIPELFLVPCLGLFSSNGWAQELEGKRHICLALEFPHEHMDITLAHEIAHGLSEGNWSTVLDGLYNEGYATFVSSLLYPGHNEEEYFFMDKEWYLGCLDWLDRNRHKILEDSVKAFKVLDEYHLFYFGGGNADCPRIGYVIGYEYLKFLNEKYSLKELQGFGIRAEEMESEFKSWCWSRHNHPSGCRSTRR
jgi:hypothetical protein